MSLTHQPLVISYQSLPIRDMIPLKQFRYLPCLLQGDHIIADGDFYVRVAQSKERFLKSISALRRVFFLLHSRVLL